MSLTRRAFLERLGYVGGVGATYLGMQAMGLLNTPPASATPFRLPPGSGNGRSAVILGAGIAGLVSAYELQRAGWRVTLIEARDRVAGRVWTVRGGDRIEQIGRPDQQCTFSDGMYLNAGAARIPSAHHVMLGYARELSVPLEVMVNSNRAAKLDVGGRIMEERQLINDVRGRVSELLSKAVNQGALDADIPRGEREAMRQFLSFYGELDRAGAYAPRGRSGYLEHLGAYQNAGRPMAPLPLADLLSSPNVALPLLFEDFFDQQAPMFQPVGGMDRIAQALAERLRGRIRLNSPITAIRRTGERVRIHHGRDQVTEADYCVCALPANLLGRVASDFSPAKQAALRDIAYLPSVKVAFQARRFWEQDEFSYGGLGWTDQLNENVIYPSGEWHRHQGVLVGGYCAGWMGQDNPTRFTALSHEERFAICRRSIERLHPGRSRELTKAVTVAWALTPWSEGVGPVSDDFGDPPRTARYGELLRNEGPIFFAGEHLSYVIFWQEGAALSAHEAVRRLTEHAAAHLAARRG